MENGKTRSGRKVAMATDPALTGDGVIRGRFIDELSDIPIRNGSVKAYLIVGQQRTEPPLTATSDRVDGSFEIPAKPGSYDIEGFALGQKAMLEQRAVVAPNCWVDVTLKLRVRLQLIVGPPEISSEARSMGMSTSPSVRSGAILPLQIIHELPAEPTGLTGEGTALKYGFRSSRGVITQQSPDKPFAFLDTQNFTGPANVVGTVTGPEGAEESASEDMMSTRPETQMIGGGVSVALRRTAVAVTDDLPLWLVIKKSTDAISFKNYKAFMDLLLCKSNPKEFAKTFNDPSLNRLFGPTGGLPSKFETLLNDRNLPFTDVEAYRLLKVATEAFLMINCGVALKEFPFDQADLDDLIARTSGDASFDLGRLNDLWSRYLLDVNGSQNVLLPYLELVLRKFPELALKNSMFSFMDINGTSEQCFGILRHKLLSPCLLELIWSYWHEEGMLVQTLNAISVRFQNRRGRGVNGDPLANMEIDPLRPLNNLLWGYIQDEQHRLTVVRRGYEYDHHYGMRLHGRAVPEMQPADSRSQFIQAFHHLLHLCSIFYQQDDDTTVISDGFPILNALKEVHLILSQGAHNQFGDLPSTARIEMLMQEWLLARPEFREFLPTRIMVAYPEEWMDRVDAMKKLQGWTDVNVTHFRDLGAFGEKVLLSIRFGAWSDTHDPNQAKNWARFWRAEIQGYVHAYRAVTGVDVSADPVNSTLPSVLLRQRLMQQRSRA